MKYFKCYIMIISVAALFITGCTKDDISGNGAKGLLYLNVTENLDAETPVLVSKSSLDYTVQILNSNGVEVNSFEYRDQLTDPIELIYGDYTVRVYNGEEVEAGFDSPFYAGEKEITIKRKQEHTVDITTQLANVKITVDFTDKIRESFSDYQVLVSNAYIDTENPYILGYKDDNAGAEGYFKCNGYIYYKVILLSKDKIDGDYQTYEIQKRITGVEPRDHYNIQFSLSEETGNSGGVGYLEIRLNNELNDKYTEIEVPLTKEATPPTIVETNGLLAGDVINIKQDVSSSIRFDIEAPGVFERLQLLHNSDDLSSVLPKMTDLLDPENEVTLRQVMDWNVDDLRQYAYIDLEPLTAQLPEGIIRFEIVVQDMLSQREFFSWDFSVSKLDINTTRVDPWATFVYLEGEYYTSTPPQGLGFEYWKVSEPEKIWKTTQIKYRKDHSGNLSDHVYWTIVDGLEENTEYQFRVISDEVDDVSFLVPISFQTGSSAQIPGMGFDEWHMSGYSWIPNPANGAYVWDSGNKGTNIMAPLVTANPTSPDEYTATDDPENVYSAKLASTTVVGVFAAGSIYTGQFGSTVGTSGAYFDCGYEFNRRPLRLSGWYDYTPGIITHTKLGDIQVGDGDECSIYVVLAKWSNPFVINTNAGHFIEFDDDDVIAYGQIQSGEPTDGYVRFSIPLIYKTNDIPNFIAIVASASAYGDYFTGSSSSVMYLDELELEYEYDEQALELLPYPLY